MNNIMNELTGNPERASRIKLQRELLERIKDHYTEEEYTDLQMEVRSLCYGHYLEGTDQEEGNALIDNEVVKYIMEYNNNTKTIKLILKNWISQAFNKANAEIDKIQGNIMIQK